MVFFYVEIGVKCQPSQAKRLVSRWFCWAGFTVSFSFKFSIVVAADQLLTYCQDLINILVLHVSIFVACLCLRVVSVNIVCAAQFVAYRFHFADDDAMFKSLLFLLVRCGTLLNEYVSLTYLFIELYLCCVPVCSLWLAHAAPLTTLWTFRVFLTSMSSGFLIVERGSSWIGS